MPDAVNQALYSADKKRGLLYLISTSVGRLLIHKPGEKH